MKRKEEFQVKEETQLGIQSGGAGFTYETFSEGTWQDGDVLV